MGGVGPAQTARLAQTVGLAQTLRPVQTETSSDGFSGGRPPDLRSLCLITQHAILLGWTWRRKCGEPSSSPALQSHSSVTVLAYDDHQCMERARRSSGSLRPNCVQTALRRTRAPGHSDVIGLLNYTASSEIPMRTGEESLDALFDVTIENFRVWRTASGGLEACRQLSAAPWRNGRALRQAANQQLRWRGKERSMLPWRGFVNQLKGGRGTEGQAHDRPGQRDRALHPGPHQQQRNGDTDRRQLGFYGDPAAGAAEDCQRSGCPLTVALNRSSVVGETCFRRKLRAAFPATDGGRRARRHRGRSESPSSAAAASSDVSSRSLAAALRSWRRFHRSPGSLSRLPEGSSWPGPWANVFIIHYAHQIACSRGRGGDG
ncbi:hypothetical protein SKAU_G00384080 [Synaphobranchus kaupii]|uniref:Uncharacterized protein n=1 Tax=Synaphobranchus kaupii TaxID=118154 RepID=A0A9Q1EE95_SYNKA|nr:hypothetical protein SKAU_G00384080 [Synaphobranchus kaupii]